MPTTAFSDLTETDTLKHFFRNTAMPTPPTSLYIALFTTMPADDGTGGVEVSGGAYARYAMSCGTSGSGVGSAWTAPSSGAVSNVADVFFAVATALWGNIKGAGLYDASTSGNLRFLGLADAPEDINVNDQYKILAGTFIVTLD